MVHPSRGAVRRDSWHTTNEAALTMLTRTPDETDLTAAAWAEIAPSVLPAPGHLGAKRRVDTRAVVNALRSLERTGCTDLAQFQVAA